MSRVHSLIGVPDLPYRAFIRTGGSIKPQGGKGSDPPAPPPAPDYAGAAQATAQGNLEMARYATQANRPNQVTPWGESVWTNDRSFDQAGYDAAMASYNQALANQQQQSQAAPSQQLYTDAFGRVYNTPQSAYSDEGGSTQYTPLMGDPASPANAGQPGYPGGVTGAGLQAPNADDFWSSGDNWTNTVTLSPEMQALFDQQNQLQQGLFGAQNQALGRVNEVMGQGFNMSGAPQSGSALNLGSLPGYGNALDINSLPGYQDYGTVFQPTGEMLDVYDPNLQTNNATELLMQRLQPELDRRNEALRAQLANQGIGQGGSAYQREMESFGRTANDAATQAALHGINLGMQQQGLQFNQGISNRDLIAREQAQQFGQQSTNAQLSNQRRAQEAALQAQQFGQQTMNQQLAAALQQQQFGQQDHLRSQYMQEQAYLRNLPLNELNALRAGNQVSMPQFQSFVPQATTGGADMLGAAQAGHQAAMGNYQAQLGAWNAGQAANSNMLGGIMGLGGSLLEGAGAAGGFSGLFSDRRLKRNIKRIGTADSGLPIYSYRYVWGGPTTIGHMADEVAAMRPDAVAEVAGYLAVDYGRL